MSDAKLDGINVGVFGTAFGDNYQGKPHKKAEVDPNAPEMTVSIVGPDKSDNEALKLIALAVDSVETLRDPPDGVDIELVRRAFVYFKRRFLELKQEVVLGAQQLADKYNEVVQLKRAEHTSEGRVMAYDPEASRKQHERLDREEAERQAGYDALDEVAKLRDIADWFDSYDNQIREYNNWLPHEKVMADLRRIASRLEQTNSSTGAGSGDEKNAWQVLERYTDSNNVRGPYGAQALRYIKDLVSRLRGVVTSDGKRMLENAAPDRRVHQSVTVEYAALHWEKHKLVIPFEAYEWLQLNALKAVIPEQALNRLAVLEVRQEKIRAVIDGEGD